MSDKVLIHSRFPKAMLVRIGQRFDLMNAAGKPLTDAFTKEQLAGVRALITAGGTPLGAAAMDTLPKLAAIICYGTWHRGRPQSGGECIRRCRSGGDADAGRDAAFAAGG